MPSCKLAWNHGSAVNEVRLNIKLLLNRLQGCLVVFNRSLVFDSRDLAYSWLPQEDSEDRLITKPALLSSVSSYSPLSGTYFQVFHAQVPLNDQSSRIEVVWLEAYSINSCWVHQVLQFNAFADRSFLPLTFWIRRISRLFADKLHKEAGGIILTFLFMRFWFFICVLSLARWYGHEALERLCMNTIFDPLY